MVKYFSGKVDKRTVLVVSKTKFKFTGFDLCFLNVDNKEEIPFDQPLCHCLIYIQRVQVVFVTFALRYSNKLMFTF